MTCDTEHCSIWLSAQRDNWAAATRTTTGSQTTTIARMGTTEPSCVDSVALFGRNYSFTCRLLNSSSSSLSTFATRLPHSFTGCPTGGSSATQYHCHFGESAQLPQMTTPMVIRLLVSHTVQSTVQLKLDYRHDLPVTQFSPH
jgi:hypothetical protein